MSKIKVICNLKMFKEYNKTCKECEHKKKAMLIGVRCGNKPQPAQIAEIEKLFNKIESLMCKMLKSQRYV